MRFRDAVGRLLLVALLPACGEAGAEKRAAESPVPVQAEVVQTERHAEVRRVSGDVSPWEMLPLSFTIGGRLADIRVEQGDEVERGDTVAILDSRDYRLMRELARAQVEAIEPHLERAEKLLGQGALPPAKLDELTSQLRAATIQRSQAEAQLSYSRLTAPFSGVVLDRLVSKGDMVGPSRPVIVLADLSRVKVVLPVAQRDLPLFSPGSKVEFETMGLSGRLTGAVHSIGYSADPMTRTFPVILEVPNPDRSLRAGMIVEAFVPLEVREGLFVPLDIVTRDRLGRRLVFAISADGARAEARAVELGSLVGERVQVLRGLAAGDRVIVRGMVEDESPVVIVEHERAP